jgi:hypothetical protein
MMSLQDMRLWTEHHLKVSYLNLDENIPIRFFLSPYGLTPTYTNVNNRFSVQYFINLVLLDVEDRRYFKQNEIFMSRVEKTRNNTN